MDTWRLLLLGFAVISATECSVTAEPECPADTEDNYTRLEGEAFYYVPASFRYNLKNPTGEFTWYRSVSKDTKISSNKTDRIHHQREKILFLHLQTGDSGLYIAKNIDKSGECRNYPLKVNVLKSSHKDSEEILFAQIRNSDRNLEVPCPTPVSNICDHFKGNYSWFRNFTHLQDKHRDHLWVKNEKANEDIYTCLCTWTYNHRVYNSSGSLWVRHSETLSPRLEILSPSNNMMLVEKGSRVVLKCSALCGFNLKGRTSCQVRWNVPDLDGYNQTSMLEENTTSKTTIFNAFLTIYEVSDKDFRTVFNCTAVGLYKVKFATLTLKQKAWKLQK